MTNAKSVARVFEYLGLQTEGKPVEKTRLNKLLYFAQGHAFAALDRPLFINQIDAWDHGPVVAVVYSGFNKIVQQARDEGLSSLQLSPEEMDVIMDVWAQYHHFSANELVNLTHQPGSPWSETYDPNVKNAHISLEKIKSYFAQPENRLKRVLGDCSSLPVVHALPSDEYDPQEDAVWEALLHDAE